MNFRCIILKISRRFGGLWNSKCNRQKSRKICHDTPLRETRKGVIPHLWRHMKNLLIFYPLTTHDTATQTYLDYHKYLLKYWWYQQSFPLWMRDLKQQNMKISTKKLMVLYKPSSSIESHWRNVCWVFAKTSRSESAEFIKIHRKTPVAPIFSKVEDPGLIVY